LYEAIDCSSDHFPAVGTVMGAQIRFDNDRVWLSGKGLRDCVAQFVNIVDSLREHRP
jgi:hypothetical protein